jgi:hypothetical protein
MGLAVALKVQIMSPLMRQHALLRTVMTEASMGAAEVTLASDGVEDELLSGDQKLFSVGQPAHKMHFVMRGEITYQIKHLVGRTSSTQSSSQEPATLSGGMWLSEQALWCASWHHLGVAVARQGTAAEVLSLSAVVFQRSFSGSWVMKRYARCFLDALETELFTDVGNAAWSERLIEAWTLTAQGIDTSFALTDISTLSGPAEHGRRVAPKPMEQCQDGEQKQKESLSV